MLAVSFYKVVTNEGWIHSHRECLAASKLTESNDGNSLLNYQILDVQNVMDTRSPGVPMTHTPPMAPVSW